MLPAVASLNLKTFSGPENILLLREGAEEGNPVYWMTGSEFIYSQSAVALFRAIFFHFVRAKDAPHDAISSPVPPADRTENCCEPVLYYQYIVVYYIIKKYTLKCCEPIFDLDRAYRFVEFPLPPTFIEQTPK